VSDEKSTPNKQTEMTSYCIAPTLLSNARSSTKKHSRLSVRPATRSSVPNPQITVIAKRSSQAEHGISHCFLFI
jgi:hypothetical protein